MTERGSDADDSSGSPDDGANDISSRPPDPFVRSRVSDPAAPAPPTLTLTGLFGDSDRSGRHRLYLNTRLDYYVEFQDADVVAVEPVAADQPPFVGLDATRVTLGRDARVDYVHSRAAASTGWSDVDVRMGRGAAMRGLEAATWEAECPGPSWGWDCPTDFGCGTNNDCPSGFTVCKPRTCNCTENTCATDCQASCEGTCQRVTCAGTCNTCATACNQATCAGTCNTCATVCNQATCAFTCNTCATACNQATCVACTEVCTEFGPRCPTFAQTHCPTCRAGCGF